MKRHIISAVMAVVLVTFAGRLAAQVAPATGQDQHGMRGVSGKVIPQAEFVQMMGQHHRDGVEMAKLAERRAASSQVKALATRIRQGQETELAELQAFTQAQPTATSGTHPSTPTPAEVEMTAKSAQALARIRKAAGSDVDLSFIDAMSRHHQMAVDMVGQTTFTDEKLKALAQRMVTTDNRELQQLQDVRKTIAR